MYRIVLNDLLLTVSNGQYKQEHYRNAETTYNERIQQLELTQNLVLFPGYKKESETRTTASVLKHDPDTRKVQKNAYLINIKIHVRVCVRACVCVCVCWGGGRLIHSKFAGKDSASKTLSK